MYRLLFLFSVILNALGNSFMILSNLGVIVKSMALTVMFGLLIDLFLYIHQQVFVPELTAVRYLYLFFGLNLIAIAVCIYFQTSSIYLPTDFLLKAFGELMKNYTLETIIWTAIPLSIGVTISIYREQMIGIGPGTLLFMFGMGFLIDQYNRRIIIRKTSEQLYV